MIQVKSVKPVSRLLPYTKIEIIPHANVLGIQDRTEEGFQVHSK